MKYIKVTLIYLLLISQFKAFGAANFGQGADRVYLTNQSINQENLVSLASLLEEPDRKRSAMAIIDETPDAEVRRIEDTVDADEPAIKSNRKRKLSFNELDKNTEQKRKLENDQLGDTRLNEADSLLFEADVNIESELSKNLFNNGITHTDIFSIIFDYLKTEEIELLEEKYGHRSSICMLDNRTCAIPFESDIYIFDISNKKYLKTLKGHSNYVEALIYLNNGFLVSGSLDETIKIWDIITGKCIKTLEGHTEWISSLCNLPNGNIASASWDETIKIWDLETGECVKTFVGHKREIESLCCLPNGNLISASNDKTIKIWNIISDESQNIVCAGRVSMVKVLRNGNLASLCHTGCRRGYPSYVQIWDASNFTCLQTLEFYDHPVSINEINGNLAIGFENHLEIWNITENKLCKTINNLRYIKDICELPNNKFAFCGHYFSGILNLNKLDIKA